MDHIEPPDGAVDRRVMTVLVATVQTIAVALVIAIGSLDGDPPDVGAYLVATGFGLLLLARDRVPTAVLVASATWLCLYYAQGYPAIGVAVPVLAAFFSAAEHGRRAACVLAGVALIAISVVFRVLDGEDPVRLATDLVTNAALVGAAIAFGVAVRERRLAAAHQRSSLEAERARERERSARLVEEQQLRLTQDVHDSLGHALTLISVQVKVADQSVGRDDTAVREALGHVVTTADRSLRDLRRVLSAMRPAQSREPVGLEGLGGLVETARAAGLVVSLTVPADATALPAEVEATAYRIVQEAITNVVRHSDAHRVDVEVGVVDDELAVRVADDGTGTAPVATGSGIVGMQERARLLGGDATADRADDGFVVTARLPLGARS